MMTIDSISNLTELLKRASEANASDIIMNVMLNRGSQILFRVNGSMNLFKECSYDEAFALWKSIYESKDGEVDVKFDPLTEASGPSSISDNSKLLAEFRGIKFNSIPSIISRTGFTVAIRLLYGQPVEDVSLKDLGFSEKQQADLSGFKKDDSSGIVISGHIGKLVRDPKQNLEQEKGEMDVNQYGNPISIHQFAKSHADNPAASVIFHIGHGRWVPRCEAGVLLIKNVAPYTCVEDAVADLASVGILRMPVEWDAWLASGRAQEESN